MPSVLRTRRRRGPVTAEADTVARRRSVVAVVMPLVVSDMFDGGFIGSGSTGLPLSVDVAVDRAVGLEDLDHAAAREARPRDGDVAAAVLRQAAAVDRGEGRHARRGDGEAGRAGVGHADGVGELDVVGAGVGRPVRGPAAAAVGEVDRLQRHGRAGAGLGEARAHGAGGRDRVGRRPGPRDDDVADAEVARVAEGQRLPGVGVQHRAGGDLDDLAGRGGGGQDQQAGEDRRRGGGTGEDEPASGDLHGTPVEGAGRRAPRLRACRHPLRTTDGRSGSPLSGAFSAPSGPFVTRTSPTGCSSRSRGTGRRRSGARGRR